MKISLLKKLKKIKEIKILSLKIEKKKGFQF
jgi:hypothetical protein